MKKLLSIVLMNILCMASEAQVTYFDSNNFFLNYFTDTGYSSYDWRFEPLKTDLQRGGFKGNVVKVVTNMNLTERMNRSLGTTFTDTTYYNAQGNISKIVAPKKDPGGRFAARDLLFRGADQSGEQSHFLYEGCLRRP